MAQTGVQILAGFLLMVPFSAAFDKVPEDRQWAYVLVLLGAVASTVLLLSPVALHRALFLRNQRPWLIAAAHYLALGGLFLLGATNVGAIWFVADFVLGVKPAAYIAAGLLALITVLWIVLPVTVRRPVRDNVS